MCGQTWKIKFGRHKQGMNLFRPKTYSKGSRKSKIGWELIKSGCYVRSPKLSKSHTLVVFKLNIPITWFLCIFFGLLDQFGWQPPFPVANFGWWTLISEAIEAGWQKVAAKISNWLGTRSHQNYVIFVFCQPSLWQIVYHHLIKGFVLLMLNSRSLD